MLTAERIFHHIFFFYYLKFLDSHLVRKVPAAYSDGVYTLAGANRPSPRRLSRLFMRGQDGLGSKFNRTALLAFFGKPIFFYFIHVLPNRFDQHSDADHFEILNK